jgi:cytoskeleton protein RodZ
LRARSISWVQVRGGDNEILITRTLKAGDTYFLPNRSDLVMMTGSAGGLEVLVDGKPIPTLGAVGEVKRNIPLDPERLLRLTQ